MIYSWIWRKLPGSKVSKSLLSLLLLTVIVASLFILVFPAIDATFTESPVVSQ